MLNPEAFKEHGLHTDYIDKVLNLIVNAKKYGFDAKKIMSKLLSQND